MIGCISLTGASPIFDTAQDIPSEYFNEKRSISAIVQQVSDGDTFRVRHFLRTRDIDYKGPMKHHTIVVRIAAVDAPETAKHGEKGQPFSVEATEFAKSKLLNKEVKVKLLSRDQYGRAIASVKYKDGGMFGLFTSEYDISEELVRKGLAVVYRQGGAQYDGSKKKWEELETTAKQQKKGLWGYKNMQLPSDYKRQMKLEKAAKATKANQL